MLEALRQQNYVQALAYLDQQATPCAEAGIALALRIDQMARRTKDGVPVSQKDRFLLRHLVRRLDKAGCDWTVTAARLGNGDSAGDVIDLAWPGLLSPGWDRRRSA